jgi:hypothetical protein
MKSTRLAAAAGAAIAAVGLVAAAAITGCGTTSQPTAGSATPATSATPAGPMYAYYQGMMRRLYGGDSMMGFPSCVPGSALWFLGSPAPAGLHVGTLSFTAAAGTYRYLCPVPGHARDGMTGTFMVKARSLVTS